MEKEKVLERIGQIDSIRTNKRSSVVVQLYMGKEKVQDAHIAMIHLGRDMTLTEYVRRAVDIETKRLSDEMALSFNDKADHANGEGRELRLRTELIECKAELERVKIEYKAELEIVKKSLAIEQAKNNDVTTSIRDFLSKLNIEYRMLV